MNGEIISLALFKSNLNLSNHKTSGLGSSVWTDILSAVNQNLQTSVNNHCLVSKINWWGGSDTHGGFSSPHWKLQQLSAGGNKLLMLAMIQASRGLRLAGWCSHTDMFICTPTITTLTLAQCGPQPSLTAQTVLSKLWGPGKCSSRIWIFVC